MRYKSNIFEQENYKGAGIKTIPAMRIIFIILSLLSGVVAFCIVSNLEKITTEIAIVIANILLSGIPLLMIVIVFIYFIVRHRLKRHRRFWR